MKHIKYFKEEKEIKYHDIDDILKSYLETILWTIDDIEDEEDDDESDSFKNKDIYDFSEESISNTKNEIEWFVKSAGKYINNISDESIGHDLWLTRNGHGTGFWDRGYSENVTDLLKHLCKLLGNSDAYIGDDGQIYIDSYKKLPDFDLYNYMKERKFKGDTKKYNI